VPERKRITASQLAKRILVPRWIVSLYYYLKDGAKISLRAEVQLSRKLQLGPGCIVGSFTKIKVGGALRIGARAGFANGCFVSASPGSIEIGDDFICGPNVSIVAQNYVYEKVDVPLEEQGKYSLGITIGNNVWVGAGVVILDGSDVGDNTIIVANSLVNRRHPPNVILQGQPAKVILKREK